MPAIPLHHISFTTWIYCTYKYQRQMDPPVNQAEMHAILLHNISFTTGSIAHIYTKGRWTPPFKTARALSQLYAFQWHQ